MSALQKPSLDHPNVMRAGCCAVRGLMSDRVFSGVLTAMGALSLADLGLTLHFMTTSGMDELNPLARTLAQFGPWGLVALKVGSIGLSTGLLWMLRNRSSAHLAAWLMLAVLVMLGLHWNRYLAEVLMHGFPVFDGSAAYVKL